ncbi:MAG: DUF1926 domain-containing protein [Candidatus Omnitrophica bacterium]|nr:DUF1926 domain-containing protein [Candidatus Omnitrophota bacterium]
MPRPIRATKAGRRPPADPPAPGSVTLLMAVHCHQPVDNFTWVFEKAYEQAYRPFLDVLEDHPSIRLTLHYSGGLLDWLAASQRRFVRRLQALASRRQVEFLTGGYYEPILTLIPEVDRQGQIARLSRRLRDLFGVRPAGCWLAERVWEPHLAKTLVEAGLAFTIVDDTHVRQAMPYLPTEGVRPTAGGPAIVGHYVTEDEGGQVAIFPASKQLRYGMPFKQPEETIAFLRALRQPDRPTAIAFGDDGEKFGLWPSTQQWVYGERWLDRFFTAVEGQRDWLRTGLFSEWVEQVPPVGRVYLPCASYDEMQEWSGGYFRHFLLKYPEANLMRHRMLDVSRAVQRAAQRRVPVARRRQAVEELYRAQCNCGYWHGVFGGLYLTHLRAGVYRHLITAEKLLEGAQAAVRSPSAVFRDVDGDGVAEVELQNRALRVVVDPAQGGGILACDVTASAINLGNVLTRRTEPYHEKLRHRLTTPVAALAASEERPVSIHDVVGVREEGLERVLIYDRYQRLSALDHVLPQPPTLAAWADGQADEAAWWAQAPYAVTPESGAARVSLQRVGPVTHQRGVAQVEIRKTIRLDGQQPALAYQYALRNPTPEAYTCFFAVEWNLAVTAPGAPLWQELEHREHWSVTDEPSATTVSFVWNRPGRLYAYPIETVSESEEGLERTTQGVCVVWGWSLTLSPRGTWVVSGRQQCDTTFGRRHGRRAS